MFNIDTIVLEIKSAVLEAYIHDNAMEWGVDISAATAAGDNLQWKVKVNSESLFSTGINQLGYWQDIVGIQFSWEEPLNKDEDPHALMYLCQHEPVYASEGKLYLNEHQMVCIDWSGKCDIYWNDKYHTGLSFLIDTPVTFKGIWFGRDAESVCRKALSQYITKEIFIYSSERNVSLMKPRKST
ncbi:MAG TPA: hypothetical protein VN030_06720 [Cellvibrio sp.]|nr:hypothetical protein [Cellvibrio sp.]